MHARRTVAPRAATLALAAAVACAACRADRAEPTGDAPERAAPAAAPVPTPAPHAPPTQPYVPAEPWTSRGEKKQTLAPPDAAKETWRVQVHRYEPMQKPTPKWQPLPATENVVVAMQPGSGLSCIVTPMRVETETDDFGTELKAWLLGRDLLCSGDGFRSWSVHPHRVRVAPDGSREAHPARARLFERSPDGSLHKTLIRVRDDAEDRRATTGPPRIRTDLAVDDD